MYTDTRHGTVQVKVKIKQGNAMQSESGQVRSVYLYTSTKYSVLYTRTHI